MSTGNIQDSVPILVLISRFLISFGNHHHHHKLILLPFQKPSIPALAKIKAIFQLSPLTVLSAHDVPSQAVDSSAIAMNTLQTLYTKVEEKCNERKSQFFPWYKYNSLSFRC